MYPCPRPRTHTHILRLVFKHITNNDQKQTIVAHLAMGSPTEQSKFSNEKSSYYLIKLLLLNSKARSTLRSCALFTAIDKKSRRIIAVHRGTYDILRNVML